MKDDFNAGQFIEIDRANYTTILVFAKRAKLATNHPRDSYKWVESANGIQWLEITNQVKFWMSSKYLVVLTEKEISLAGQKEIINNVYNSKKRVQFALI